MPEKIDTILTKALKSLSEALPSEVFIWTSGLRSGDADERWRCICSLVTQLNALGDKLHYTRYENVDEDNWEEWNAVFSAAIELRAAMWCLRNAIDGTDENWAHDRIDSALLKLS